MCFCGSFYWEQIISSFLERRWFVMGPLFAETPINPPTVRTYNTLMLTWTNAWISSHLKNVVMFINRITGLVSQPYSHTHSNLRWGPPTVHQLQTQNRWPNSYALAHWRFYNDLKYLHYFPCSRHQNTSWFSFTTKTNINLLNIQWKKLFFSWCLVQHFAPKYSKLYHSYRKKKQKKDSQRLNHDDTVKYIWMYLCTTLFLTLVHDKVLP